MCGILGSVNKEFGIAVLDSIKHRGPDDFGMESFSVNNNIVQLAQRRLSIIDLSPAGHQPMQSECRNFSIIFNGEIYNHQELKDKLPAGINFKGHSDTETILYYLKTFGIEGIKDFNGIFSIAFLDLQQQKLYLIRDPFGVKPLYYKERENSIAFSSEIRPLRLLFNKEDFDKNSLSTLLRLRYNPSPDTLYDEIKKVRPGHFIQVNMQHNELQKSCYSYLDAVPQTVSYAKESVIDLYGQKIEEAVKRQLLSDVEIGVFLSGGVDSALVAALAQKNYSSKLKAFTIGFEGSHAEDEIEEAAETASILGLQHFYKKLSFPDFIDTLRQGTLIVEEPLATTSIIPMYFLANMASEQVKVVLTGQGADEPLGGYTRYKLELIRDKVPGALRNVPRFVSALYNIKNETISRGLKSLGIKNDIERFLSVYEVFSISEIKKLISVEDRYSSEKIRYFYDLLNCAIKEYPVERMMALDSHLNLSDDLLNYTDKITMHHSIECRVPMLDLELVKFIESLPVKYKLNLNEGKIIHKQYAAKVLPGSIVNRKKKAFQSPTAYWFRNETQSVQEILLNPNSAFSKVFNQAYIADLIKLHMQGYNKEKQIFLLLSIYFWFEQLDKIS